MLTTGWMLQRLVFFAGVGQIALALASLAIPGVLRWCDEVRRLQPLTRQIFWVYAGYICVSNLCFGLLSAAAPAALTEGTVLAAAVTGFIAAWWAIRLVIQFAVLDRTAAPAGLMYRLAELALVSLFVFLTVVYGFATTANMQEVLT